MKRLTVLSVVMALLLLMMAGVSQAAMKGSADVVHSGPVGAGISAAAGERVVFEFKLNVDKKWHLYAHGDTNFIGVDLEQDEAGPLTDIKIEYPHGHEGEFFGEKVMMIEGKNLIKVSGIVPASLDIGEHALSFSLTVQACDDKTCLPPAYIPVSTKLTVQ